MTTGVITSEPSPDWRGSTLAADAASGATVLSVDDTIDFDDDDTRTRWLVVGESAPLEYVAVDDDADTVTLAAPTSEAFEAGLPVVLWDPTVLPSGAKVVEYLAPVRLSDDSGTVDAVVPHELIPLNGIANLVGAQVGLFEDDGEWYVGQVYGRSPVLDLSRADVSSAPPGLGGGGGVGQTFSTEAPSSTTGFAENHAWWQVVDGEVVGFWRLTGGAWLPTEVVTAQAIESLSALNLTAVNAELLTMSGGSLYIAQGTAGTVSEAFSGTSLPAGWTSTKNGPSGTGSGGASVPGASVVSTGPTGQSGSALLIDFGASGLSGTTAQASGEVYSALAATTDAEVRVRYQHSLDRNALPTEEAYLAVRSSDGTPFSSTWDAVTVKLIGGAAYTVESWSNGTASTLGTYYRADGNLAAGTWLRAALRVQGGAVAVKIWREVDPEPNWTQFGQAPITAKGRASVVWRNYPLISGTAGQDVWFDQVDITTFTTGFTVNPDGTGEWPAIGLGPGDAGWRTIGATGEPAFQNGWIAGTGGNDTAPRFRKEPTNIVRLTGTLQGGASGSVAFTLPVGRRPVDRIRHLCWQSNSSGPEMGLCTIDTTGEVRLWQSGAASLGKFDVGGVTFSLA